VESDSSGRIRLISQEGSWIVSTDRNETAPKYRLDASQLPPGKEYRIDDLPRYLDPRRVYLELVLPRGEEDSGLAEGTGRTAGTTPLELTYLDISSARRYQPLRIGEEREPLVMPDPNFSTLVLKGDVLLVVRQLGGVLPLGELTTVDMERNTVFFELHSAVPNYPVYVAVKRGRRFSEVARGRTGPEGRLMLYLDRSLLEGEEIHLLHGSPTGSKRLSLTGLEGGILELEQ